MVRAKLVLCVHQKIAFERSDAAPRDDPANLTKKVSHTATEMPLMDTYVGSGRLLPGQSWVVSGFEGGVRSKKKRRNDRSRSCLKTFEKTRNSALKLPGGSKNAIVETKRLENMHVRARQLKGR